jgi:hypothetical protein
VRLVGLCLVGLAAVACRAPTSDFHSWGTFNTTRVRLGDTCRAVDGGNCFTATSTTTLTLGLHSGNGEAVLKRAYNVDALGTQVGSRFLFDFDTADGGVTQTICGCKANTHEMVWGELHSPNVEAGTVVEDAGSYSTTCDGGADAFCAWWIHEPPCGTDPGLSPEGWLPDGGAPADLNLQYTSFTGTLVDELSVAPDPSNPDGGCLCLPCRVTYQLSGSF